MRSIFTRRRTTHQDYLVPALVTALILLLLLALQVRAAPPAPATSGTIWQTVDAAPLAGQRVTAVIPEADNVWVGTDERGLARWDGQKWQTYGIRDGLPDERVVTLFRDRQGRLWVASGTGLGYLPSDGSSFRRVSLKGVPLPVLAMGQADDGAILLGGPAGLVVWQPDGGLQRMPGLAGKRVLAVRTGRDGVTWIGTSAGLWKVVNGSPTQVESAGAGGPITAIAESANGILYVFGDDGAWQRKDGIWQKLPGPNSGGVMAAAVHDGTLWLGGSHGVMGGQADLWQTYDAGLLPSPAVTALAWDGDGRLWVGTTAGLAQHQQDRSAPVISIKTINGISAGGGTVELQTDRLARFEIAAQDQETSPASLRVFVRLDGIDQAPWMLSGPERRDLSAIAVYAGKPLAVGTYVLRAWAQDEFFNRSPEAQATFTVPAFTRGPAGMVVRQDLAFAAAGTLALVLTAGATMGAAVSSRRRQATHSAEAAAASVRMAKDRRSDFYTLTLPLRQQEVREVIAALESRSVVLLGEPGVGKTATLGQIAATLPTDEGASRILVPATLDLASVQEEDALHALLGAVNDALHPLAAGEWPRLAWSDSPASAYGEPLFSADLGLLLAWLQPQFAKRLTIVLILDNAGMLDTYHGWQQDAFRRLILAASAATSPVRLILAAESIPGTLEGFADLFQTVQLAPLGGAAAAQLLREETRGMVDWDSEAEHLAVERAAGNSAALTAIGFWAAQAALADDRLRILAADVP